MMDEFAQLGPSRQGISKSYSPLNDVALHIDHYQDIRPNVSSNSWRGKRTPASTLQMLSDAVYRKEVDRLSSSSSRKGTQNRRPYSADMALQLRSTFNPYHTTYKQEYYKKDGDEWFGRPPSHLKLCSEPLRDQTTYKKEYKGVKSSPNEKLWSGGNNPHPSQAFMVWKYPTNKPGQEVQLSSSGVPSLTNDKFDKVMRGKCRSTYQVDYKGLPPGFMPAELANIGPDWKSSVPHTLDSTQRISYQAPHQPAPLSNNTVRFGCSADDRHRLLVGIAPNASKRKSTVNRPTTYDRFYNDNAPNIGNSATVHFPTHARTVVKGKGAGELSAMYEDIKRQYFPKNSRTPVGASPLNGYHNAAPILTPDPGVPQISPGAGIIPTPDFITTPVPEPICEAI